MQPDRGGAAVTRRRWQHQAGSNPVDSERSEAHVFSADRPINSSADDALGRAGFAQEIATAIGNWRQRDSLVLAIRGPWGSGKTSVKGMVVEALNGQGHPPKVLEFSPWAWAGQDQLVDAFFREIGVAVGQIDPSRDGKKRAALWRKYAAQLHVAELSIKGVRSILFGVLALLTILGVASAIGSTTYRIIGGAIGGACLLLILILGFSRRFASSIEEMFVARAEADAKTLPELKRDLSAALTGMPTPIVIILDDLDRLTPAEVRLMLQLVKANADLPQLVYVMLFERAIVEEALNEHASGRGRDFLDKIVQVSFDIPVLDQSRLNRVLFEKLDELLSRGESGKRFDSTRWGNLYIGALQSFFSTLRDVNRFIGTLSFHLGLLTNEDTLDVNPIDLIALEALRQFEPDVYARLPEFKELLTSVSSLGAGTQVFDQQRKAMATELGGAAVHREAVLAVLAQLFPPVETYFGGPHNYGPDFAEGWQRDLRVCSQAIFDRYFFLSLPETDISQGVIDRILAVAGNRDALTSELRAVQARGLFDILLERLEAYKQEIAITNAVPFVTAFFDVGDDISEATAGMFAVSPMMHAVRVLLWYLKQESGQEARQAIVLEALSQTTGLNFPVRFVVFITPSDTADQRSVDEALLRPDLLPTVQQKCVELLSAAATDGRLAAQDNLASLLAAWREWGDEAPVRAWVGELIGTDDGFLSFLRRFVQPVRTSGVGDHVATTKWRIILGTIEPYVTLDELRTRLSPIDASSLNDEDKRAVTALRQAIERRDRGIADTAFGWDE
jgi:predicted KAP-like P-loop ATPase